MFVEDKALVIGIGIVIACIPVVVYSASCLISINRIQHRKSLG